MNLLDKIKSLELALLEMSRDDDARHYDRVKMAVELSLLYDKDRDERKPTKNEVSGKELKKREDFLDRIVGNMGLGFRRFKYIFDRLPEKKDWIGMNYEKTYERLLHEAEQDKLRKQAEQREHVRKLREERAEKERKEAEAAAAEKAKQDRLERERLQREAEEADKLRKENEKLKGIIQAAPLVDIKKAESLHEENKKVIQQAIKKAVVKIETEKEVEIKEVQREAAAKIERAEKKAQVAKTLEQQLADMTADRDYWKARAEKAEAKLAKISPTTNGRHHNTRRMNGRTGSGRVAAKKKSATHSNR